MKTINVKGQINKYFFFYSLYMNLPHILDFSKVY